ncbi:MAG: T9SS type A sorting domain-containing protein [Saprospiraceae bacterium]
MKVYITLFFVFLSWNTSLGQTMLKQTLGINGKSEFIYANNKSYFFQQSIGQASVINTFNANNHQLRQGFLQPIKAALINSGFDTTIDVLLYPNPFDETINLEFEEVLIDEIIITLHNIIGQQIHQEKFAPTENLTFQFHNLPIGTYILRGHMRSQTFALKIIKQK